MEYRFVFLPAFGLTSAEPFYGQPVNSYELAEGQLSVIANYTLHLHEQNLMPDFMPDFTNAGHIEGNEGDEWVEIDEDDPECLVNEIR